MNTCKNPDKIYIQPNAHDEWFEGNKPNDNFVEYIRRDALLEWVKKEMKEWSSDSNTAQGVKMGLTLVIDKIELL